MYTFIFLSNVLLQPVQSVSQSKRTFCGEPCFSFGSSDAAEAEEVLNGPSTSMNLIFTVNVHTDNAHTRYHSCPLFVFSVSAPFPYCQRHILQHLSISLPLSSQRRYLSPLRCHNTHRCTHTHTQTGVSHRLTCLCHAAALTFDILTQLSKMSANYLHTMHHTPSFTSFWLSEKHFTFCCLSVFVSWGKA